jgi:hypothetical protein
MTVPTSWSSAALSTFSPIANFAIENYPSGIIDAILSPRMSKRFLTTGPNQDFRNSDDGCC